MSGNWQRGDLAVCVNRDPVKCRHGEHLGHITPPLRQVRTVMAIGPSRSFFSASAGYRECDCITLAFDDGSFSLASRCRKIIRDEHEACEPEFVTLLKRTKRQVSA